jgi:hypothetical protein
VSQHFYCVLTPDYVFISADQLSASFGYAVVSGVLVTVMALVLLATVSYHCAATLRWLRGLGRDTDGNTEDALAKQAAIRISHSLPDLKTEPIRQEYVQDPKDGKKVSPPKICIFCHLN